MSQMLTRTAYARNQANSEAPIAPPRIGHVAPQTRGHGATSIPFSPQHLADDFTKTPDIIDAPNSPVVDNPDGVGDPDKPDRDPDPPGDDPNDGPDGEDVDERNLNPNLTVRELLRFLSPILADRRGPPPAAPPHPRRLKVTQHASRHVSPRYMLTI